MTNKHKVFSVIGLTAAFGPGALLAAPPVGYDGWTATAGAIDTSLSCNTTGISCTPMVEDAGFIQEKVYDSNSDYYYIRMIVTDPNAEGAATDQAFTAESFIPFAIANQGISQGIAAKNVVREFAEGFTDQAEIQRAMMRFRDPAMKTPAGPSVPTPPEEMWAVRLLQTFDRDDLQSTFEFLNYTRMETTVAATPDTNDVIGFDMSISQIVPMNPDGTADADPNSRQQFEHRQISGSTGNVPGDPPGIPGNYFATGSLTPPGSMTLGGATVSWQEKDHVSTSWVVQSDVVDATNIAVSAQNVVNHTTGTEATELGIGGMVTPLSPFDWDAPTFGPEPVFP